MKHSEGWYQRRLQRYFDSHFEAYEYTAKYYADPAENEWKFDIPELGVRVRLTCNDRGIVTELRDQIQ